MEVKPGKNVFTSFIQPSEKNLKLALLSKLTVLNSGPVVQRSISAKQGLNCHPGILFFCSKQSSQVITRVG